MQKGQNNERMEWQMVVRKKTKEVRMISSERNKVEKIFNGIVLPKLFWRTVRKKCSSDREKLSKFEAEGREFAKWDH